MPSYTRNVARDVATYVKVSQTQNIFYGFKTKDFDSLPGITAQNLSEDLGHLTAVPPGGLILIRPSAPKPPRVRKVIQRNPSASQQGSVSTFCDPAFLAVAFQAGWELAKRAVSVSLTNNSRTISAIATLSNGLLYVVAMNAADFTEYGGELGLSSPSTITTEAERAKLVRGSSIPRPGLASKTAANGGTITKPYSTGTNIEAAGWTSLYGETI